MAEDIVVYAKVQYDSPAKAKEAFLDSYLGAADCDRADAATMAGLSSQDVDVWFTTPMFIDMLERRLRLERKSKSDLQSSMLASCHSIIDADITDLFEQTESGNLIVKNIKNLPKHLTLAVKKMKLTRRSVQGIASIEFEECLDIEMHDKTKVMNIIGDYTDIRGTALKNVESGGAQMVGISLITALPEIQDSETEHANGKDGTVQSGESGEVQHDPAADDKSKGPVW